MQLPSEVDILRSMLAAQQQQLQQLQQRAADSLQKDEAAAARLDKDDAEWDPDNDSDYEDAPKKRKASAKKKGAAAGARKKQRRDSLDDDSCSGSDSDADVQGQQQGKQEKVQKAAGVALRSVNSALNKQMIYRPSLKHGNSRASLELPCLSEAIVKAMLGPQLLAKASNGKKQLQLKASNEDLAVMYDSRWSPFSKSLRYGARLELNNGLTFTVNKATSMLKVHGTFTMMK